MRPAGLPAYPAGGYYDVHCHHRRVLGPQKIWEQGGARLRLAGLHGLSGESQRSADRKPAAFKSIREVPTRPDLVSVYLPPATLLKTLADIAARGCDELWLNPGTDSAAVLAEAGRLKLNIVQACSITGIGLSPDEI